MPGVHVPASVDLLFTLHPHPPLREISCLEFMYLRVLTYYSPYPPPPTQGDIMPGVHVSVLYLLFPPPLIQGDLMPGVHVPTSVDLLFTLPYPPPPTQGDLMPGVHVPASVDLLLPPPPPP